MMERRWNTRRQLQLDMALLYDGLGIVRCRTRDISLAGVFIETGAITLPHNADIEVVLDGGGRPSRPACRLPAQVVRVGEDGVGARFRDLEAKSLNFLQGLLGDDESAPLGVTT